MGNDNVLKHMIGELIVEGGINTNLQPETIFQLSQPRILETEQVYIPDIRFLTQCPMPAEIDLGDQQLVVDLLSQLVIEEKDENPLYRGMFIYGSLAHGGATNKSDIDGIHVTSANDSDESIPDRQRYAIKYRLKALFEICYDIPMHDGLFTIPLTDLPAVIKQQGTHLDSMSIPLGLSGEEVGIIDGLISYSKRDRTQRPALAENSFNETEPHKLVYPDRNEFPWWVKFGLLESEQIRLGVIK